MTGGWIFASLVKIYVERPRPDTMLIAIPHSYSFPSAHATIAIIFFSLLMYLFKDEIQNHLMRIVFIIFNILGFLSIGFSRIYLNVHWMSDVLAGFGLGMFWLTFSILVLKIIASFVRKRKEKNSGNSK